MSQGVTCPVCHTANRSNAKFCAHCGAALTGATAAPAPQRLQPGALVHNGAYRILRPLSKGGMGMIYLAEDLGAFGRSCVIKEMLDYFDPANPQETQEARQRFEDEARTLAKLNHPQIPNLLSYFSAGQHNYIVMKYVEGATLENFVGQPQTTTKVVDYGVQVCEILEYLGGLNPPVVHQDIKPANIIVDSATQSAWLVDFGIARHRPLSQQNWQAGGGKTTARGTPGYAAPEQYQPGQSEPKSDVYALAATLYHVLTGDDPQNHPFSFPQVMTLPAGLADALSAALEQDVRRRSPAAVFRQVLEKTLRTPATKKASTVQLVAASQYQSYAVMVVQPVAAAVRAQVVSFLAATRGLPVLDAEVLTWQTPACYLRGVDAMQAQDMVRRLKPLGVTAQQVETSQLHSWRQNLTASEQKALISNGEVAVLDKRFPQDRICHCHRCHHQWTTQARDQTRLREVCPRCGQQWFPHRIFRCAVCGHESAHGDVTTPAMRLFPACPACKSDAWQPGRLAHFSRSNYALDIGSTPAGTQVSRAVVLQVKPTGVSVAGRSVASAPWLVTGLLQGNQLAFTIDTHALPARRRHSTTVDIIANAGVAQVTVDIYVEAPPLLTVTLASLDFGIVRLKDVRTLKLELRNTGEQVLGGQITCADGWLTLDKPVFTANQYTVRCTVAGDRLPGPGVHTTTLAITSNGGALNVPVRVEGLPPTLTVTPQTLDFQIARRRSVAPQSLVMENVGLGLLTGALTSDAPWLRVCDATLHSNYLETLVEVDAATLEPGESAASIVNIATNGGMIDVPVTVQVAAPNLLELLVASGRLRTSILLLTVIAAIWFAVTRWEPLSLTLEPTPIETSIPSATLTPSTIDDAAPDASVIDGQPTTVHAPEPIAPMPTMTVTPVPSATTTPIPTGTTTSLQILDRLRTLAAQGATLTEIANDTDPSAGVSRD